ncbi:unnamed protein product [Lymnaea stagnalis]|uniref:Ferric-chelate reductase 1 n=1 Tax=Lymnaea stagnalis TaxID=6523 RepID=A0AAV2H373_LYMST
MSTTRWLPVVCVLLITLCPFATSFEEGAPFSTCLTRYPKHETSQQTSTAPYDITFSPSSYNPNDLIKGILIFSYSQNNMRIKGIQMAAFRAGRNSEEVLGQFTDFPINKIKAFTCFGSYKNNMITHNNDGKIFHLELTWKAPADNVGDIVFKTTIVEDYEVFWVDIPSKLFAANSTAPVIASQYPIVSPSPLVHNIDFSNCGNSKGCFLYPSSCSGDDCVVAVTFDYNTTTDSYSVELTSNSDQNYVALGFSDDRLMGQEETISCISASAGLNIQHGYNPAYFNDRKLTMFVTGVEIKDADGRLQCRFILPKTSKVYLIKQQAAAFEYSNKTFDHSNNWYLQVAWGSVMQGSDVMAKHKVMPPVSFDKINLKDKSIFRGSSYGYLVKAHGALMMIAWMFITGVITVISRHYREWLPRTRWFGTKVWFQVHRALAILVVVLTALGLVVVFAEYGAEIRESSIPHSVIGLIVTGLVGIQLIAGMLRPGPEDKLRVYFNWGHRVMGQLTHLLAAVTMFLAFGMETTLEEMKTFGFIVLSIWLVGQVVWHIIFEFLSFRGKPLNATDDKGDTDKDKKNKASKLLSYLLIVYVVFLAALCIAGLAAFLIY